METTIYNQKGEKNGEIKLPESIFGLSWNGDLVHQVVTSMLSSSRKPVAHTKTRGEVSGGGKKPWKQKGTGRARHGSTRSPIWVGGGITHGPRNDKNYFRKVNRKMKVKAIFAILSKKYRDNELIFVDSIAFNAPKTKDAVNFIQSISKNGFEKMATKVRNSAYIVSPIKDESTAKSFRNIPGVLFDASTNVNPIDLLNYKYFVISNPKDFISFFEAKFAKKDASKEVISENTEKKEVKVKKTKKAVSKKSPASKKVTKAVKA